MSFRPSGMSSFSAEQPACVVGHGRNSESDTDGGDEGLGEHDGSFRSGTSHYGQADFACKPITRVWSYGPS